MRKIAAITAFAALAMLGTVAAGDVATIRDRHEVSRAQYQVLISQCGYADTADARAKCRSDVAANYRIGDESPALDCRTFSSVTVCGELPLNEKELECIKDSVDSGMTYRRSEVECYAFM